MTYTALIVFTEGHGGDLQALDVVHDADAQAALRREGQALGKRLGVEGGHEGDLLGC